MKSTRYSVMILPKAGNQILLQKLKLSSEKSEYWDGFGSFYNVNESSLKIAQKVFIDNFEAKVELNQLELVAELIFSIEKPHEIVTLYTDIYFINMDEHTKKLLINKPSFRWHKFDDIPYHLMHQATGQWLPLVIKGEHIKAKIIVKQLKNHLNGVLEKFTQTASF